MRKSFAILLVMTLAVGLSGCGKLFGGVDDTVLPGAREDAIPGHSSFPEAGDTGGVDTAAGGSQDATLPPADTGQTAQVDCTLKQNKADPACADTSSSDGTFSDGQ